MGLRERLDSIISRRITVKAWYSFIVVFFILIIILPTLFVLSYAITGWDEAGGEIFAEPEDPVYREYYIANASVNVTVTAPNILDITDPAPILLDVQSGIHLYLNYSIHEPEIGTPDVYYWSNMSFGFPASGTGEVQILANESYNEIKHIGDAIQNLTVYDEAGTVIGTWESTLYLRAGSERPWDMIQDAILYAFAIAAIVTAIDFVAGLPMAWIMVRKNFRGKQFLDTLIDMPLAIPTAALGFSTALFWAVTPGVEAWGSLSLVSSPMILIILLHIVFSYPYMVRSLAAILHEIDINYEVAAQTLGAPPFTVARTITLPLFRAGLVTGIILCFARSLSETGGTIMALAMLTPGLADMAYPMQTGPTLIGAWKHAGGFEPQLAFTSMLLVLISLILLVVVKLVVMKFKMPLRKVFPGPERLFSRGIFPKLKDGMAFAFMFIVLIIPSFFIISFAFTGDPVPVDWGPFWSSMGFSFLVAGAVTVLNILFGVPLAILIVRGKNRLMSNILDVLVNVPLIVPTSALGVSLGMFWGSVHIEIAVFLVIMAHLAFTFPLIVRNVAGSLEELDPTYEETARTLGAKPVFVFKKVMYPSIKYSILAGAIMAFTRSLGETGATLAVVKNANTVPVYIVDLVKHGTYYPAALACIVLISITFFTMIIMRFIAKRTER